MKLKAIDTVNEISPEEFQEYYFKTQTPVVIKNLSKEWAATTKWNWEYLKQQAGDKKVGIYNNVKSDAHTPVNTADAYTTFGNYIDMVSSGPAEWRIFLFNVFSHAPEMKKDFSWPDHLVKGFVKHFPMLFVGGKGSVTHMHFDIDLGNIFHTQFAGKKRVLLFPHEEKTKLYHKPFEVLSIADFTKYYEPQNSKVDYSRFPALHYAEGYDLTLEHGDTLYMPGGYWHHMEYLESGFAMSLRALPQTAALKCRALWNMIGMRNIDTVFKKTIPDTWYAWKEEKLLANAYRAMMEYEGPSHLHATETYQYKQAS